MKKEYTNLYYELQKRAISTEEFAGAIFSTTRSVENWYTGITVPFRSMQTQIAKYLNLSIQETRNLFDFEIITK
jgi:hypothetical protein